MICRHYPPRTAHEHKECLFRPCDTETLNQCLQEERKMFNSVSRSLGLSVSRSLGLSFCGVTPIFNDPVSASTNFCNREPLRWREVHRES